MRNTSKIKRVLALGLIFLLSINSFAASSGDNDGSAFITKAEFDSLKNNFQAQIDAYNQGIDSKIDTAIASYLSGIKVAREQVITNYYDKYTISGQVNKWPLVWCSAKATTDLNTAEKDYFASMIYFRPFVDYVVLFGVQNKYTDGKRAKIYGGAAYKGPIADASHNEFLDIYKLTDAGTVDRALRTKITFTLLCITESGAIVNHPSESTSWDGYTNAKKSTYNFGSQSVYTNFQVIGRIWAQGVNTAGEFAMVNCSDAAWTGFGNGQTLVNIKSTDCVDDETTVQPCVYPFGGSNIKVNASKPNTQAVENEGYTHGITVSGDSNSINDVVTSLNSMGMSPKWGSSDDNSRRVEWTENCTLKHNYYPNKYKCNQTADASQFVFENFKAVHAKNDKICNGVVLCDIPDDGLLKVKMTPSNKGKIYLWQANASGDTWGGKKSGATINESLFPYNVNVTTAGTAWERSFDVKKDDGPLWLVYAPNAGTTGGSLQGTLDNVEISLEMEG